MSKVDKKTVEYVANLARIDLAEAEKKPLIEQLSKILSYVDKLKELNTDSVEPMRNLHEAQDVLREDEAKPSAQSKRILENSPLCEGDYFKIPKVLE